MSSHATLDDWIARDAIPFTLDSPASIDAGVDRVMRSLGDSIELLGLGEALHGSEEILLLRNRLFERLACNRNPTRLRNTKAKIHRHPNKWELYI